MVADAIPILTAIDVAELIFVTIKSPLNKALSAPPIRTLPFLMNGWDPGNVIVAIPVGA